MKFEVKGVKKGFSMTWLDTNLKAMVNTVRYIMWLKNEFVTEGRVIVKPMEKFKRKFFGGMLGMEEIYQIS